MNDTALFVTIFAGATGAASIKLIDNVVQWFLTRKDKKDAAKDQKEAAKAKQKSDTMIALESYIVHADDQFKLISDCVAILAIEQLTWTCKQAIHNKQISLGDRQRIHAMYTKAHAIGVNGDLTDLLTIIDELPLIDPMHDDDDSVTEHRENI